jgi:hypothetical protein
MMDGRMDTQAIFDRQVLLLVDYNNTSEKDSV